MILFISDLLARWLNADLYKTDFRPVPLSEKIKIGDDIYDNQFQFITKIRPMINIPSDTDHLVYLSLETVVNGHSVLIFCPTKNWCEKVADTVAKEFFNLGKPSKVPDKNDRVRFFFHIFLYWTISVFIQTFI
jgi:DNA polymerase theta